MYVLNFMRSKNILFPYYLANCGLWGGSACYGSIRLVKLVSKYFTRAYNLTSEAKI